MPILRSTGLTWKDWPICGRAVAITVPSRFSMKNAPATRMAMRDALRGGSDIYLGTLRKLSEAQAKGGSAGVPDTACRVNIKSSIEIRRLCKAFRGTYTPRGGGLSRWRGFALHLEHGTRCLV